MDRQTYRRWLPLLKLLSEKSKNQTKIKAHQRGWCRQWRPPRIGTENCWRFRRSGMRHWRWCLSVWGPHQDSSSWYHPWWWWWSDNDDDQLMMMISLPLVTKNWRHVFTRASGPRSLQVRCSPHIVSLYPVTTNLNTESVSLWPIRAQDTFHSQAPCFHFTIVRLRPHNLYRASVKDF